MPLIRLALARSGDKGDHANIGVIARKAEYLPYIKAALGTKAVIRYFAHVLAGGDDAVAQGPRRLDAVAQQAVAVVEEERSVGVVHLGQRDDVPGPQRDRQPQVVVARGPGGPAAGDRGQHVGGGLDRGALHVVEHAADAAELLDETLQEEKRTDALLSKIAASINAAGEPGGAEPDAEPSKGRGKKAA